MGSVIGVIPARGGSRRVVGKNMRDFCGSPLFIWTVGQALGECDRVVVSSDDEGILWKAGSYDAVKAWADDAEVKLTKVDRPARLAEDWITLEEVLDDLLGQLGCEEDDVVCLLQPTSPLRLKGDIRRCAEAVEGGRSAMSVCLEDDLYLWNNHWQAQNFIRQGRVKGVYYRENGSVYAFRVGDYLVQRSRYIGNPAFVEQEWWQGFELDREDQWPIMEDIMRRKVLNAI